MMGEEHMVRMMQQKLINLIRTTKLEMKDFLTGDATGPMGEMSYEMEQFELSSPYGARSILNPKNAFYLFSLFCMSLLILCGSLDPLNYLPLPLCHYLFLYLSDRVLSSLCCTCVLSQ
eukprot:TRINITY_DN13569_c0_g1_i1.p2 TRINITY_DN13569_c0_g1~~TRINITY_DN13569_c0_g1_i1.p2  ORF type:complete len:118 (+),score=20.98 TRINITY_DN13569_c0_g1_i1:151-504(+)